MKSSLRDCISSQITISRHSLDNITSRFTPVALEAREIFAEAGRVCSKMAFIKSGVLRLYNYADDKEITLWVAAEHQFVTALSSFIFQKPSTWYIEAVTDSALLVITRTDHFDLLEHTPEWLEFDNRMLAHAFTTLEERVYSHLYMTAEERYRDLMGNRPDLFNRVPLRHIASMLGITPETLSRLRSRQLS